MDSEPGKCVRAERARGDARLTEREVAIQDKAVVADESAAGGASRESTQPDMGCLHCLSRNRLLPCSEASTRTHGAVKRPAPRAEKSVLGVRGYTV